MSSLEEELATLKQVRELLKGHDATTADRMLKYLTDWNKNRPAEDK